MMTSPRLRSLEDKHAILERAIGAQDARPRPDELELARLKREKLRLKEEIEKLRRAG
nr:YdcH family protein [Belnapia moabensis]